VIFKLNRFDLVLLL